MGALVAMLSAVNLPRFVIFEGIDGVGKTTLARALARYYRLMAPAQPLFAEAFPGARPGTLGEWVYRLHHGRAVEAPDVHSLDPMALQILHIAAHVDAMRQFILPALARPEGGAVILDRFWWSTYAYSRPMLPPEMVLAMVAAERMLWKLVAPPIIVYLTRAHSLKPQEIDPATEHALTGYYDEVIALERSSGQPVQVIANDGSLAEVWARLLVALALPAIAWKEVA